MRRRILDQMSVSLSGLQFDVARPPSPKASARKAFGRASGARLKPSRHAVVKSAVARAGTCGVTWIRAPGLASSSIHSDPASLFDIANATAHVRGSLKITASVAPRSVPARRTRHRTCRRAISRAARTRPARLCCPVAVRPRAFCFFMSVLLRRLSGATREAPTLDAHGLHVFGDPLRTRGAGSKSASRTSGGVHAGCIRRLILGHCRLRLANAATAATSSAGSAGLPMCI